MRWLCEGCTRVVTLSDPTYVSRMMSHSVAEHGSVVRWVVGEVRGREEWYGIEW